MELDDFSANFPELYAMMEEDVRYYIAENNINGEHTLKTWEDTIDNLVNYYEQQNYYGFNTDVNSQQIPFNDFRDWDRDFRFRRRRRRFRDFNTRDILRLLFLRELFDRRR